MDANKVDMWIMMNQNYLPAERIMFIRERLLMLDEARFSALSAVEMKDPVTYLLISIFLGHLGIDRFMLGDTGMGVLKLLTLGCCGILAIIDMFTISNKVKEQNYNNLMMML